jgi:hypothetical protein
VSDRSEHPWVPIAWALPPFGVRVDLISRDGTTELGVLVRIGGPILEDREAWRYAR